MPLTKALILIDLQNDFMPGGALGIPHADEIIPTVNQLIECFPFVLATQDWHPKDHVSFASNHKGKRVLDSISIRGHEQVLWPDHCVKNTPGAAFVENLNKKKIIQIFRKGIDSEVDSYSGFYDNWRLRSTGLSEWLKSKDIEEIWVAGIAMEYCVKATAIDGVQEGFRVFVATEACRFFNVDDKTVCDTNNILTEHGVLLSGSTEKFMDKYLKC